MSRIQTSLSAMLRLDSGYGNKKMVKRENPGLENVIEEHLPSRRTFLLRFSDATRPETGVYHGRIEHIGTGKTIRFTSLKEISEFAGEIMTVEERGAEAISQQENP